MLSEPRVATSGFVGETLPRTEPEVARDPHDPDLLRQLLSARLRISWSCEGEELDYWKAEMDKGRPGWDAETIADAWMSP